MPCVTHHDACECRMEIVREHLVESLRDYVYGCTYCCDGDLHEEWAVYPRYRADDGSCVECFYGRAALQLAKEAGWLD